MAYDVTESTGHVYIVSMRTETTYLCCVVFYLLFLCGEMMGVGMSLHDRVWWILAINQLHVNSAIWIYRQHSAFQMELRCFEGNNREEKQRILQSKWLFVHMLSAHFLSRLNSWDCMCKMVLLHSLKFGCGSDWSWFDCGFAFEPSICLRHETESVCCRLHYYYVVLAGWRSSSAI